MAFSVCPKGRIVNRETRGSQGKAMAADLACQRQTRHRWSHPFGEQSRAEFPEGRLSSSGSNRGTLEDVFQITVMNLLSPWIATTFLELWSCPWTMRSSPLLRVSKANRSNSTADIWCEIGVRSGSVRATEPPE